MHSAFVNSDKEEANRISSFGAFYQADTGIYFPGGFIVVVDHPDLGRISRDLDELILKANIDKFGKLAKTNITGSVRVMPRYNLDSISSKMLNRKEVLNSPFPYLLTGIEDASERLVEMMDISGKDVSFRIPQKKAISPNFTGHPRFLNSNYLFLGCIATAPPGGTYFFERVGSK